MAAKRERVIKKTTRKKTAASSASRKGASYSTRFSEDERQLIEEAARIKQWKPAQFIRDAAVERAVEVLNASDDQRPLLEKLAQRGAEQLIDARVRVHYCDAGLEDFFSLGPTEKKWRAHDHILPDYDFSPIPRSVSLEGLDTPGFTASELEQLKNALSACPTEFVDLMLAHWQQFHDRRFNPPEKDTPEKFTPKFVHPRITRVTKREEDDNASAT